MVAVFVVMKGKRSDGIRRVEALRAPSALELIYEGVYLLVRAAVVILRIAL